MGGSRPRRRRQRPPTRAIEVCHAHRSADRRRRLPGLNAVIRAVVRKGVEVYGHDFVGLPRRLEGPARGRTCRSASPQVRGILPRGGTILGSSPHQPDQGRGRRRRGSRRQPRRRSASTRSSPSAARTPSASRPARASDGLTVVGVPKTIDNDLGATDYTFGFDTAVHIAIGGDRPAAHDGRVAPPRAHRRGDGPARRLDRAALRPRRRGERHPHPRAAVRHRRGLRATSSSRFATALRADHRRRRGRAAGRGRR